MATETIMNAWDHQISIISTKSSIIINVSLISFSVSEQDPLIFIMDVVFTIGFTFIVIFGTSGNAIVLWIVIGRMYILINNELFHAYFISIIFGWFMIVIKYFSQLFLQNIGHRQMWNSTNYFLVNLSIADLLMAVANTLFNFIYMRDK